MKLHTIPYDTTSSLPTDPDAKELSTVGSEERVGTNYEHTPLLSHSPSVPVPVNGTDLEPRS